MSYDGWLIIVSIKEMDIEGAFIDTNDFELTGKKLGEGAFGKVYVVEKTKEEKQYAAKIITISNGILNGHDQMLFLRESMILYKLKHPAIVQFYGINFHSFDNPDKLEPTIITEYLPNGSLKQILKKEQSNIADSNWTPTKKYICLLGITDAMRYLHKNGILHRDLKPENILVDENYYPRVCDFGLSRCFSQVLSNSVQLSMTGKIGTPIYMAPELMLEDEGHFTPSVDVYSFSIIAYEVVSGKEPFSEGGRPSKLMELVRKVTAGTRPEFPEGVTDKMMKLITDCWSQNPEERPSFEEIFKTLSSSPSDYFDEDVDEDEIRDYIELLEDEAISSESPIDKNKEEIKNLKDQNIKLEQINKDNGGIITKLTNENTSLKREQEESISKIQSLNATNLQIKKDQENLANKVQNLTNENVQIKKEKEELVNTIQRLNAEIEQMKIKLNELNKGEEKQVTSSPKEITDESKPTRLHVKICEAKKVLKMNLGAFSDPYVTVRLKSQDKKEAQKTQVISNTMDPIWNQEFDFIVKDPNDILLINMYDEDIKSDDKMMDELEFPVSTWLVGAPVDHKELDIKLKKKKAGRFIFEVQAFQ